MSGNKYESGDHATKPGVDGPIYSFDIYAASEEELNHQLDLLRQREPNMLTPFNAATALRAIRKAGITGGKDHSHLQCSKNALHVIMGSDEPLNYNDVLANEIQKKWSNTHMTENIPHLRIVPKTQSYVVDIMSNILNSYLLRDNVKSL